MQQVQTQKEKLTSELIRQTTQSLVSDDNTVDLNNENIENDTYEEFENEQTPQKGGNKVYPIKEGND